MKKIEMPKVEIGGVEYTAKRPTMGMWRKCVKQEMSEDGNSDPIALMDARLGIIKEFYGIPDDKIEDIDVADVLPAYRNATKLVWTIAMSKMGELPNEAGENAD